MADARQVARWIMVNIAADILGRNRFSQSLRHNSAGESQHQRLGTGNPSQASPRLRMESIHHATQIQG